MLASPDASIYFHTVKQFHKSLAHFWTPTHLRHFCCLSSINWTTSLTLALTPDSSIS